MRTAECINRQCKFKDPASAISHLIGMIMAIILYESCEILNIVVEDNYRRKGIDSNLMDTLI